MKRGGLCFPPGAACCWPRRTGCARRAWPRRLIGFRRHWRTTSTWARRKWLPTRRGRPGSPFCKRRSIRRPRPGGRRGWGRGAAEVARDGLGALWFPFLKAQFDPPAEHVRQASLEAARAVWRLGSPLVVTTNYDKVLRWASPQERDLRHWTVSDRVNLVEIHRDCVGQPAVWHLHGFIDRPEEIILTPDGYSMLYPTAGQIQVDYEAALVTLRHLLTARTFLFIGFGMEEAIQRQIRWVRETFGGAGGKHFVLVKADAQEAMEKELHGLSVQPVPFADFGQPLLDLLGELASHADS